MSKYVYLFELDSVRKTDEEIVNAQQTLYDEIVVNGNTVVMTYNQIADSRGFFCLLNDTNEKGKKHYKKYYENIIKLFEMGKIKVSQYGDTRSLTQYLLNSLEDEKKFIYSALPIKNNQKRLMALMRRSLTYTDLCEINEYRIGGSRSDDEIKDLFIELNPKSVSKEQTETTNNTQNKDAKSMKQKNKIVMEEQESALSIETMRTILENLYWMLSAVLKLSSMHHIYFAPREKSEYNNLLLYHYLRAAISIPRTDALWCDAIEIINRLPSFFEESIDRSVYLRQIKEEYIKEDSASLEPFQYAEAIVNVCYNYACEASICNISKHYDVNEIKEPYSINSSHTFYWDFLSRLSDDWQNGNNAENRYLINETNEFTNFNWTLHDIPNFEKAVRLSSHIKPEKNFNDEKITIYEYDAKKRQKKHKKRIRRRLFIKTLLALAFLAVAFIAELLTNDIQSFLGESARINGYILQSVITIAFLLITEIVTTLIQKKVPWFWTLSDALSGFRIFIVDFFRITRAKSHVYFNKRAQGIEGNESSSKGVPIDFVKTSSLRQYIKLYKSRLTKSKKNTERIFAPSDIYQIYDVENNDVIRMVLRNEEIYNRKYGVIYQSPYNILLVDPVKNNGKCIPYERMTPASGYDGVIMVAKYNNNYILLNQFRHALREKQYSFPRGFAESANPIDDALRELKEELNAQTKSDPYYLGQIAADSGLTTTRAYVYYVDIESYSTSVGHEGIVNAVEVPCNEFEQWIKDNKIDDGYTLGAFMLLKTKMSAAVG